MAMELHAGLNLKGNDNYLVLGERSTWQNANGTAVCANERLLVYYGYHCKRCSATKLYRRFTHSPPAGPGVHVGL